MCRTCTVLFTSSLFKLVFYRVFVQLNALCSCVSYVVPLLLEFEECFCDECRELNLGMNENMVDLTDADRAAELVELNRNAFAEYATKETRERENSEPRRRQRVRLHLC